jgi:ABC-type cobalamin transport system ATPase subunit
MTRTIRDVLSGTDDEQPWQPQLDKVVTCLADDGPIVVWIHGPVGAGKTSLLAAFGGLAADRGASVISIDCRTVEPTEAGLLQELSEVLGQSLDSVSSAASAVSALADRAILAFDNYEVFRLADAWLRREFIPQLSASARVLMVSAEPPAAGWISAAEWQRHFLPVSLAVAADLDPPAQTRRYLADISNPDTRRAIEAASVIRRITQPMLGALCPGQDADTLFEEIADQPFVETRRDGLAMLDVIHREVAERLNAADPERYRGYQRVAWKQLREQLRNSAPADLWRTTADVIYLIENPVIREAFFPSKSAQVSVETAMPGDQAAMLDITSRHEPDAVDIMALWWKHLPGAFHIVRDTAGDVVGFYCIALPTELRSEWMAFDPVARQWQRHLEQSGKSNLAPSLFLRRWLSREAGEAPSPEQAAAWIDVKRTYLELRPALRRVYLALRDIGPYGPVATQLGFAVLDDCSTDLGDLHYHTAMLDFGPGSVDGWIVNLVAAELGIAEDQLLDKAARELVVNGSRVSLTPLEFGVVSMLESRPGEAVSRTELLKSVWGHDYDGGSNVVDAVVRGLRRKCGEHADILETVRGVGYRLRAQG